ncbi:Uncharacterised protein [Mycobacteroides abscessus subsp. abscessus]|nr:Uncharacterised protein [Mycobacteroides abscessus subsp. abscessus]
MTVQLVPSKYRCPGAPDGSGYQPGAADCGADMSEDLPLDSIPLTGGKRTRRSQHTYRNQVVNPNAGKRSII